MADKPVPSDRDARAAIAKVKEYNAFKARQSQAAGEPPKIDEPLQTVETWAADQADAGKDWAQDRELDANERIAESQEWQDRVRQDEKDAAEEAQTRAKMDVDQMRDDMKKVLDDYRAALKEQAENDQQWAKEKLAEVAREHAAAKKFLDEKLEKALDMAGAMSASRRQQTKLIAEQMAKRAEAAKQWKAEYADQPGKHPAGQRADVQKALDEVGAWADHSIQNLEPLGAKAAPHVEALQKAQAWSGSLAKQIDGAKTPAATKSAKEGGAAGVAETRETKAKLEAFLQKVESDGNEATEVFARWTEANNEQAAEWINSKDPKQRQWAEAWMKTQE